MRAFSCLLWGNATGCTACRQPVQPMLCFGCHFRSIHAVQFICNFSDTNDWCNFVAKKTNPMGAKEMAVAAYHKKDLVYFYKGSYNNNLGKSYTGATVHDHGELAIRLAERAPRKSTGALPLKRSPCVPGPWS